MNTIELLLTCARYLEAGNSPCSLNRYRVEFSGRTWFESLRSTGGNIESEAVGRRAVEVEGDVGIRQVKMRPDLDRPISRIEEDNANTLSLSAVGIQFDASRPDPEGAWPFGACTSHDLSPSTGWGDAK
jgi:hypothetical protein